MNVNFKRVYPPITEETRLRNALLDKLNEIEKQHKTIRDLQERIKELEKNLVDKN